MVLCMYASILPVGRSSIPTLPNFQLPCSNDIEPRCEDTYNIVTRTLSEVRVLVPRRDFVRATEVLTALRQH